jgi:GAF domain-containing protein
VIAPVGLTYAMLSRRLLDVGFALNRAAVFSVVSVVLVGTFMIVEWALGGWLARAGHVSSTTFSIALAVGLGFSIRFVHARADHAVDALFFRQHHVRQQALLRFAHEAAYVSDADALVERTVQEVARNGEAASVAVLVRGADATYASARDVDLPIPDLTENDPGMVAMRASGQALDLHRAIGGGLRGEYAFPMLVRGALVGVLVCGPKHRGEPYAPDERETLAKVAHAVGLALHSLVGERGQLEAAILALHDEFSALRAEVRDLAQSIRAQRSAAGSSTD